MTLSARNRSADDAAKQMFLMRPNSLRIAGKTLWWSRIYASMAGCAIFRSARFIVAGNARYVCRAARKIPAMTLFARLDIVFFGLNIFGMKI